MANRKALEKKLDAVLGEALKEAQFLGWFLSHTKFSGLRVEPVTVRWNYPWGSIPYTRTDPVSGIEVTTKHQSETDILVTFRDLDQGGVSALHIENKVSSRFTPLQPELYRVRAEHWRGRAAYDGYQDYETILVAPKLWLEKNSEGAAHFDRVISYETLATKLAAFGLSKPLP